MNETKSVQVVNISSILVDSRIRVELGDIDGMMNSIREHGLIQPIVLDLVIPQTSMHEEAAQLVTGGRRLAAVKRLGWKELRHGIDFIWLAEKNRDPLRRSAVELEENLRRKELTWQEVVVGKQRLLEIMQQIHGTVSMGAPTAAQKSGKESAGFGVNKLAAMLGESAGTTSRDLQIANLITKVPALAKSDTKESAFRKLAIVGAISSMRAAVKPAVAGEKATPLWTLYEGDFREKSKDVVPNESVDLVYTDLPFGVSLSQMSKHAGPVGYEDSRTGVLDILDGIAAETFRVLRHDRYAVFFFGFNYYTELIEVLKANGLLVSPVPVVWYKHTRSTENPNTRYANAYDAALVATKGSPVFIRPGRANVIDIPAVTAGSKLQIAQQPVALINEFLLDMTTEGATVLDWCAGSGTTGEAAVKLKRRVILFEKEPAACTIIRARLGAL